MKKLFLLLVILLFCSYFLVLPMRMGKEVIIRPQWALPLRAGPSRSARSQVTWFRLGDTFGYFEFDGELRYSEEVFYGVALSDSGFINYTTVSENLLFYDTAGNIQAAYNVQGYPILSEVGSRLFVVQTDLAGLAELGQGGEPLWERDYGSLILCMAANENHTLVGLLDGRCQLLDNSGGLVYELYDGEPRYPAVYGCALTQDSRLIAVVAGIDPQILWLAERQDERGAADTDRYTDRYTVRHRIELERGLRREIMLRFVASDAYLLVEDQQGVSLYDTDSGERWQMAMPARVRVLSGSAHSYLASALVADAERIQLMVFGPMHTLFFSARLPPGDVSLRQIDQHLIVGTEEHLLRLDIVEG